MLTRKAVCAIVAPYSMTTTTKRDWIRDLTALAQRNYDTGYGWQVLIECFDQTDWIDLVEDCETYAEAEAKATQIAEIHTDRYNEAQREVF